MALTDREIIKERAVGQAQSMGLSSATAPKATIAAIHQYEITWDIGADATIAEIAQRIGRPSKFIAAYFTPATGLAVSGSAYVTALLQKRDGAGGAASTVATWDTNSAGGNQAMVAFVPLLGVATTTPADLVYAAGNLLTFKSTETSTPATPIGKVTVTLEYI
jgi:hypothetical protein